jgi:HSP20 family protein
MELVRWRPRRAVPGVYGDVDRMFDDLLRGWMAPASLSGSGWSPSIDISESDSELVVSAEVPGVRPEDIDIEIDDSRLVVSGEKKQENEEKGDNYYRVERSYGSFRRVFSLPQNVDSSSVKASSKDGVLRIRIPKSAVAEQKKVEIEVE